MLRTVLPAVEDRGQHFRPPRRIKRALFQMCGDRTSSFSIGTIIRVQAVGPCRALVMQVS